MQFRTTLAVTAACLLAPIQALAEDLLTERFSDAELIQIMRDDGYTSVEPIRDGALRIKIDGRSYILINNADGDLQAYYAIGGANISLSDINKWNQTKRLSRAYLDADNDPTLEADLLANGGLTAKHVTEFFRVFQGSANRFLRFIVNHNKS